MKHLASRLGQMLFWIGLGIAGAALYGILNDQITVTLSPEYFSVFKREQFADVLTQTGLLNAPTRIQAIFVGILATWWFGLFLGIVLSISSRIGPRPALSARDYLRAIGGIMLFSLCLSIICGGVGNIVEPYINPTVDQWPFLEGIHEVRRAFAVGFWHDGAYLGGLLGTILAVMWAQKQRNLSDP